MQSNTRLAMMLLASGIGIGADSLGSYLPAEKEKAKRTLSDIEQRQAKNAAKRARRAARAKK